MSSQSSSSSSPVLSLPQLLEALGCLLADADDVLARLERRFRLIDVEKLSAFAQKISSVVDLLEKAEPDSQGPRLVDDQSSEIDSESSLELDVEEYDDEC